MQRLTWEWTLDALRSGGGSSAPILSVANGVVTATARQNPAPTLVVENGVVTATARQ